MNWTEPNRQNQQKRRQRTSLQGTKPENNDIQQFIFLFSSQKRKLGTYTCKTQVRYTFFFYSTSNPLFKLQYITTASFKKVFNTTTKRRIIHLFISPSLPTFHFHLNTELNMHNYCIIIIMQCVDYGCTLQPSLLLLAYIIIILLS